MPNLIPYEATFPNLRYSWKYAPIMNTSENRSTELDGEVAFEGRGRYSYIYQTSGAYGCWIVSLLCILDQCATTTTECGEEFYPPYHIYW